MVKNAVLVVAAAAFLVGCAAIDTSELEAAGWSINSSASTITKADQCAYLHDSTPVMVRDSSGDPVFAGSAQCEGALAVAESRDTVTYTGSTYTQTSPVQVASISGDVAFDVDSAVIKGSFYTTLDRIASEIQGRPSSARYTIVGHTDASASNEYNQELSERRARAVASYLISKGVASSQLSVLGLGETRPIASNSTDAGKAQNRRVEIYQS
ncbi:OmpA family protein [Alphaproteobacteria bacterium]|nr:OmpA family protein [Alphaproteobacteria bacterium]MDA8604041.1 OmpA family protein [Alphaproteobacteria bacterium]